MHVPNQFPDKQRMIEQLTNRKKMEQTKELLENTTLKNQSKMKLTVIKQKDEVDKVREFEDEETPTNLKEKKGKKQPIKQFQKVIEMADIVLEVLDARDPANFRCSEAEQLVASKTDKKLVFVLTKIDLVPLPVLLAWKRELEKEHPVILFKGATQKLSTLSMHKLPAHTEQIGELLKSTKSLGTHKLFEFILSTASKGKDKKAISVGVIGYPQSGKNSVINAMKRKRAAGVTTSDKSKPVQEFDKIKIIESPGVITSEESESVSVLRNQANPAEIKDPVAAIESIIEKVDRSLLMSLFKIGRFETIQAFLYNVAVAKAKYQKVVQF